MKIKRPQRLVGATILGLGLAVLMLLQALSSITMKQAPQVATAVMPMNGLARERLAFATFGAEATDPTDMAVVIQAAARAAPIAREALADEPLLPKAHTVLALELQDQVEQAAFLDLAGKLNRRDVSLQGVLLQNRVVAEDYAGVFQTVDRILRVNPELSEQFFPILLTAFQDEKGLAEVSTLTEEESPWIRRFFLYAVEQPAVLEQLAELRSRSNLESKLLDQQLIANLADQGDFETASRLYAKAVADAGRPVTPGTLDWYSDYTPFDWRLTNRSGLRAQIERDGSSLDVNIRPGQSGILADRKFRAPAGAFRIAITHSLGPVDQLENTRVQLRCGNRPEPIYTGTLVPERTTVSIADRPQDCAYVRLTLYARVLSTERGMSGNIESVQVAPQ